MTDDCMLPGVRREIPTLSKEGYITHEILRNGVERGEENLWIGSPGDAIGYEFETPTFVSSLRAVFDSNFNRIVKNMPCSYPLHQEGFEVPKTLIRDFDIILTDATGAEKRIPVRDSHVRLFTMPINAELKSVHLKPLSTWGEDTFRIFSLEVQ